MWKELAEFLKIVRWQIGKSYVYGFEVRLNDPDPKSFDCSELVQWAFHQVGLIVPDGSYNQWVWICQHKTQISVELAMWKGGSLLFRRNKQGNICHVGISMGDGTVVEARGKKYGVVQRQIRVKDWDCAGVIAHL